MFWRHYVSAVDRWVITVRSLKLRYYAIIDGLKPRAIIDLCAVVALQAMVELAEVLKLNQRITGINLSSNDLGLRGAEVSRAIASRPIGTQLPGLVPDLRQSFSHRQCSRS